MSSSLVLSQRLLRYAVLARLNKPIGILLLLWPTLWALWLAQQGMPSWHLLWIFCCGVVVMRSAGCVINDVIDRKLDPHVMRTQQRPLACHVVQVREAVWLFIGLSLLGLILLLQLNELAIRCGTIALGLIVLYPFAKRYTHFPQVILGLTFYTGIPIAFAATLGHFTLITWWLYIIAGLWALIYDTFYAMVDREDDINVGIKSTAVLFGKYDRFTLGILQLLLIVLLYQLGQIAQLHWSYNAAVAVTGLVCCYHQYLIRQRQPAACFRAFLHSNWIGFVVLIGIIFGLFR